MKHRHKWKLTFDCISVIPDTCGLLYTCECGSCLEFDKKKPNLNEINKFITNKLLK